MLLKEKLKAAFQKIAQAFDDVGRLPYPEREVQKEMEKEGWRFNTTVSSAGMHYMVLPLIQNSVTTPQGRPAIGEAAPEDRALYINTINQKRRQMGLTP